MAKLQKIRAHLWFTKVQTMMKMKKLDIKKLQKAFDGK